jgi:hypothetical protein
MKHSQIEDQQIVERYIRNQLNDDQRSEFQAHFFACDECFTNLQTMERFIAGVRDGAESGLISADLMKPVLLPFWNRWFKPAFAITAIATLVLTAVVAWLMLVRLPELRNQLALERHARDDFEIRKQREIDELNNRLTKREVPNGQSESGGATLQSKPDEVSEVNHKPGSDLIARNVPVAVLASTRGGEDANQIKLFPNSSHFACWMEVGPGLNSELFQVEAFNESGTLISLLREVKKNRKGVVVATFSAQNFSSGDYRIRLYGLPKSDRSLIGDYKLHIDK